MDVLKIGTLSPVSILSLTMQVPESKIKSQGKTVDSGTLIKSPGTKSIEFIF